MAVDAEARKAEVDHLNKHARSGGDARMFKIDDDPRATASDVFSGVLQWTNCRNFGACCAAR
jgi:hypothetical protein